VEGSPFAAQNVPSVASAADSVMSRLRGLGHSREDAAESSSEGPRAASLSAGHRPSALLAAALAAGRCRLRPCVVVVRGLTIRSVHRVTWAAKAAALSAVSAAASVKRRVALVAPKGTQKIASKKVPRARRGAPSLRAGLLRGDGLLQPKKPSKPVNLVMGRRGEATTTEVPRPQEGEICPLDELLAVYYGGRSSRIDELERRARQRRLQIGIDPEASSAEKATGSDSVSLHVGRPLRSRHAPQPALDAWMPQSRGLSLAQASALAQDLANSRGSVSSRGVSSDLAAQEPKLGGGATASGAAIEAVQRAAASMDREDRPVESQRRPSDGQAFWRAQVEAVYRRHNPAKLQDVDRLMQKHRGSEAVLYRKVCARYGEDSSKFSAEVQKVDVASAEPCSPGSKLPSDAVDHGSLPGLGSFRSAVTGQSAINGLFSSVKTVPGLQALNGGDAADGGLLPPSDSNGADGGLFASLFSASAATSQGKINLFAGSTEATARFSSAGAQKSAASTFDANFGSSTMSSASFDSFGQQKSEDAFSGSITWRSVTMPGGLGTGLFGSQNKDSDSGQELKILTS